MRTTYLLAALTFAGGVHSVHTGPAIGRSRAAEELLAKSAAAYAALESYADSGTFTEEYAGVTDRFRFRSYFRRPTRDLFFEWQGVTSYTEAAHFTQDMSRKHLVIWMARGDLQTYDADTRSLDRYPPDANQAGALNQAAYHTRGVSTLVPSMLYNKANLLSVLRQLRAVHDDGMDDVDGYQCHRLTAVAADQYSATQRVVNVRPVTIWIDAKSLLIRKLFEGTPKGGAIDAYHRKTVQLRPEANPHLDNSRFEFTVPSSQP
jgi:hypothetical protein